VYGVCLYAWRSAVRPSRLGSELLEGLGDFSGMAPVTPWMGFG
jgi:hypothetical protein